MKTLLLSFVSIVLCIGSLEAQISIDENSTVGTYQIVRRAHDTISSSLSIGSPGSGQQYYFTSAQDHYEDTMTFTAPSTLPGSADFPTANLGVTFGSNDSTYLFMKKNPNGLYLVGRSFYQGGQLITMQLWETIITFPSQMGSLYGFNVTGQMAKIPVGFDPDGPGPHAFVDSVKIIRNIDESSTIDGLGTISTPLGAFNSLRQNTRTINTDTVMMLTNGGWDFLSPTMENLTGLQALSIDTIYVARWWTNDSGIKAPVAEATHNNAGTVYELTWLKAMPQAELGELEEKIVKIYPNPANDAINVETILSDVTTVVLLDAKGSVIRNIAMQNGTTSMDVSDLDNGIYFLKLMDNNEELVHDAKVSILK